MNGALTHDDITDLLGAYALDAVDPEEAEAITTHLSTCPRCRAEVAEHHRVAALLANSGGNAPTHLWAGIAERVATTAPQDGAGKREFVVPIGPTVGRRPPSVFLTSADLARPGRHRIAWRTPALVAAAAIVILVLGVQVAHLNHQVGRLQALSQRQGVIQAAQAAQANPQATHVTLDAAHTTGQAVAEIVFLPSGTAFVVNSHLPVLPATQTYQLWGKVHDRLVSLGLLGSHPSDVAFRLSPSAKVSLFAVTAERAGGVVQSTQVPVAEGKTTAH